ncbi:30S ribosomal protein S2-like [Hibiscus syriacus]|uniref:30S ribosomal protein S2-like n=1 Tax=Hibiscus syriacus TaxID=106335 RepID=UPI0019228225|nr:30S ribosomal protein S2-like [Hibiscus syriacus]
MPFNSHKPSISSIESDGNTKGSRCRKGFTYALGRKNDESEESSNGIKPPDSSSREEIVALFRKIQSSIARDKWQVPTESVMDVLHKSGNNLQDFADTGTKALRWRSGNPKKRQAKEKAPAEMDEFNLSRPPSNFMKKSPILHPTAPRTRTPENFEAVPTTEGSASANIEKLKLSKLKELAKARGIKGYSKLSKCELLQLLIPLEKSN